MKVALVGGTAGLGYGLALRLASCGIDVAVGSRKAEKAADAASAIEKTLSGAAADKGAVTSGANEDAVKSCDLVVVTVPFPGQAGIYKTIMPNLGEATVLDCTVPLASEVGGKATRMLGVWEGSAAQQARGILDKATPFASGFHTVMAGRLEDLKHPLDSDVLICGDKEAKKVVQQMVEAIPGARMVDCGPLERARILESLTALLIGINIRYKLDPGAGINIVGL